MRLAMLVLLETNQMSPSSHSLITFSKLVLAARPPLLSPWPIFMVFNQKSENCAVWKSPTIPTAASTICQKNTNAHIALLDCLSHKAMQNGGSRRSNSFFLLLTLQTWNVTISKMSIESAGKALLYYLGLPEF